MRREQSWSSSFSDLYSGRPVKESIFPSWLSVFNSALRSLECALSAAAWAARIAADGPNRRAIHTDKARA